MSVPGRYCCKSLFALLIKNSPGCRRDFRVKMWGTSSPDDKLTGDLGSVIETAQSGGRRLVRVMAGKSSPGKFWTFTTVSVISRHHAVKGTLSALPPKADIDRHDWHVRFVPILLQKSAISTAKRLTRFFEAYVAVCSIGSRL
jgi:hypothetical protein